MDEDGIEELITADPGVSDLYIFVSFSVECRRAMKLFEKDGFALFDRFECGRNEERKWCMEFMVSNEAGPKGIGSGPQGPVMACFKREGLAERIIRASEEANMVRSVAEEDEGTGIEDEMGGGEELEDDESDGSCTCGGESGFQAEGNEHASFEGKRCEEEQPELRRCRATDYRG